MSSRWFSLIIGLILAGCPMPGIYPFGYSETETRKHDGASVSKLVIENLNGGIEVSTWEADTIAIELLKTVRGRSLRDARVHIGDIEIEEEVADGVLRISVRVPRRSHRNYQTDFKVRLPARIEVELKSTNGRIRASGLRRGVKMHTTNGSLRVEDLVGDLDLKTTNGSVLIEGLKGSADLRTTNGRITAQIDSLPPAGYCRLKTTNGSIKLALPAQVSARLDARAINGRIHTEGLSLDVTELGRNRLKGRLGTGEGEIKLRTTNGSIHIRES